MSRGKKAASVNSLRPAEILAPLEKTRAAWPLAKRARVPLHLQCAGRGGGVAWPALVELPCGGSVPVWWRQLHNSGPLAPGAGSPAHLIGLQMVRRMAPPAAPAVWGKFETAPSRTKVSARPA